MTQLQQDALFTGTLSGEAHWELADECQPYQPVRTLWEVQGELTPLGPTKAAGRHCADDRGGGFNGRIVFSAASGDTLRATYTFETVSETPTLLIIKMTGQFADGGTGRFVRASGSFEATVHVHKVADPPTVESVWPVEYTFDGRIGC